MQPIIIEDSQSIAANTVVANVIALNTSLRRYLRSPFLANGKLLAVVSSGGVLIDMDYGSKNVVSQSAPRVASAMEEPQDVVNEEWYPDEGDQLVLRASNTTGAAITLRYRIVLFPLGDQARPPDCRVMQRDTSIAAGGVDTQLLDGTRYERPPVDSILKVLMSASATGLLRQLYVDTDSIAPPSVVNPTNRMPQDPFDTTIEGVEVPADKLISLSVSNPTAGALSAAWKVKIYEQVRT